MSHHFVPESGFKNTEHSNTVNGRFVATGTFFCYGQQGRPVTHTVRVPGGKDKTHYLIHVSLSLLTAPVGDFDEDDTVFADIYEIDGRAAASLSWEWPSAIPIGGPGSVDGEGGAWGHHLGELGYYSHRPGVATEQDLRSYGFTSLFGINPSNMRISSMVAEVSSSITFRLSLIGDSWAAASYFVLEL